MHMALPVAPIILLPFIVLFFIVVFPLWIVGVAVLGVFLMFAARFILKSPFFHVQRESDGQRVGGQHAGSHRR